jgi:hypothetical protein
VDGQGRVRARLVLWLLLAPLGLLAIGGLSALSIRVLPAAFINVPRKDYWLTTPERRAEAAAILFGFFLWMLLVLFTIGAGVTHAIFVASRDPAANQMGLIAGVIVRGPRSHPGPRGVADGAAVVPTPG